ncbi:MAG TPA: hypothetical protein VH833_06490 [Gemmatimonadales bacterium]
MKRHRLFMRALAAGWLLVACGGDSSGPGSTTTATANDPTADFFGAGVTQIDMTGMTITRDTGGIDVVLNFTATVLSPVSGNANALFGQVDFDVDQDTSTGLGSLVDVFRPDTGSTRMGVDFALDLFTYNADSTVNILDTLGAIRGQVRPVFSGSRVSVRIRRTLLGSDDGFVNAAVIIGTASEPTDITPNNGHLRVGGTGPVAPYRPGAPMRPAASIRKTPWN